jgi:peroxiredoxin Q/BCP
MAGKIARKIGIGVLLAALAAVGVIAASQGSALAEGSAAPGFSLPDQEGKIHRLSDYRGKWVALAFYPVDKTPGCTLENRSISAVDAQLREMNAKVFAISVQDSASKASFCEAEGLTHTLLADTEKEVSRAYGVLGPAGVSNRVTFIVDPSGKIAKRFDTVNVRSHGEDLVVAIRDLQASAAPAYRPRTEGIAELKPGDKAPDFKLKNLTGEGEISLAETLKKSSTKAVALVWVSHACPVSRDYEKRIKDLAAAYKNKGVVFLAVDSNSTYGDEPIIQHFKKEIPGLPVLRDPGNRVADAYGAKVTPEVFLICRQGVIRYHGAIDDSQDVAGVKKHFLKSALDELLAGKTVSTPYHKPFGCTIKRVKAEG